MPAPTRTRDYSAYNDKGFIDVYGPRPADDDCPQCGKFIGINHACPTCNMFDRLSGPPSLYEGTMQSIERATFTFWKGRLP